MSEIDDIAWVYFIPFSIPWAAPVQVIRHKYCGEWSHNKPVYVGQSVFCLYCGKELQATSGFDEEKETRDV